MDIQKIIAKMFNDEASVEELEILESWKKESEENLNELRQYMDLHKASAEMKDYKSHDVEIAWQTFEEKIDASPDNTTVRPLFNKYTIGIAAAILLAISAYFILQPSDSFPLEYVTENDTQSIELPDGSTILLDHNSKVVLNEEFINNRNLTLYGRAYFSVAHTPDDSRFTVEIPNATITVLGTEFSIATEGNDGQISVASGRVEVNSQNRRIQLSNGDLLLMEDNNIIKTENKSSNYFAWTDHNITYKDTPILNIFKELDWIYDIEIDYSKIQQSVNCRLSTNYNGMGFQEILKELQQQFDLDYVYKGSTLIVNDINCS